MYHLQIDHDLEPSKQIDHIFPIVYDLYDIARVARSDPCDLHDLSSTCFPGRVCTMQILQNLSLRPRSEELLQMI